MFAQKYRLRTQQEVLKTVRASQGVFDTLCGIRFQKNTLGHPRFAVIVGIKVSKKAVERNRIRRQYREICKKIIKDLPALDIALLVTKSACTATFAQKEERLRAVCKKAKILS